MNTAQKIEPVRAHCAKWVLHFKVTELNGFTYDQMKKYRQRGIWEEGRHWRYNPVGTIVYNPVAIDEWCEGL